MLLKTRAKTGKASGVRFINGSISFASVHLNVYSFEVDGILIDTGSESLVDTFKPFFKEVDIDKIVITHDHEDHTGGAAFLQQTFNIPIYINEMSVAACEGDAKYPMYRKLFWGKRKSFRTQEIGNSFTSRHAKWDVIATPGHTQDHLSFLNRETGQLFSGDLYVHPKTKVILRDESIPDLISSLKKILTYDFAEVFCCHAGYIQNGRKALEEKLNYLRSFQEKVLHLHSQGWREKEIQNELFPKRYPITYLSFGEWSSAHMIRSILSKP